MTESGASGPHIEQNLSVAGGIAYGVISGDINIVGDKATSYLLRRHRPSGSDVPSSTWQASLDDLRNWRSSPPPLAVRWLQGAQPDSAQLCSEFADDSAAAGWMVTWAIRGHDNGAESPDQPPWKAADRTQGLLLIAESADEWPPHDLTWLFSDSSLHNREPVRILLSAQKNARWPAIRGTLANNHAATSRQALRNTQPGAQLKSETVAKNSSKLSGHAFISYVREDSKRVDRLQHALESAGIPVWRDTSKIWPGEDWQAKIRTAITQQALTFIACFSRNSLARQASYHNAELLLAIEQLRKRQPENPWLIPVRLDDCPIPDRDIGGGRTLNTIQRADLFGDNFNDGITRLVTSIRHILPHPATVEESQENR